MKHDTLSNVEIDSLLAGLSPASAAAPAKLPLELGVERRTPNAVFDAVLMAMTAALQARLARIVAAVKVTPRQRSYVGDPFTECDYVQRAVASDDNEIQLRCSRELIASLVDYRFGGNGAAAHAATELSVIERRTADLVFEAMNAAWRECHANIEYAPRDTQTDSEPSSSTAIFDVQIGIGGGALIMSSWNDDSGQLTEPVASEPALTHEVELTAVLGRLRISANEIEKLCVGDVIAFKIDYPIQIDCSGTRLLCQHGAYAGRHALRVLSLMPNATADLRSEPWPEEFELTLEIGRAILSAHTFRHLAPGQMIPLARGVNEPLPLMRDDHLVAQVEILVLPDGHAARIIERGP